MGVSGRARYTRTLSTVKIIKMLDKLNNTALKMLWEMLWDLKMLQYILKIVPAGHL